MKNLQKVISNPLFSDKTGTCFGAAALADAMASDLIENPIEMLSTRGKETMSETTKKTTGLIDKHTYEVKLSVDKLMDVEKQLSDATKKVSSKVRSSTETLKQGLERIQKQADFNTLERYVSLLERASIAIEALAKIHDSGKLDKIANALK